MFLSPFFLIPALIILVVIVLMYPFFIIPILAGLTGTVIGIVQIVKKKKKDQDPINHPISSSNHNPKDK